MQIINSFTDRYYFLSNFYPSEVNEIETTKCSIQYPTVEHAYQAAKTLDTYQRNTISQQYTPSKAKLLGRHVYLRPDWENIKDDIMETYLRQKFNHPDLREKLLNTENAILIEGNTWHDNYWGDCYCEVCKI